MKNANPVFRRWGSSRGARVAATVAVLAIVSALAACAKEKAATSTGATAAVAGGAKTVADYFPIKVGDKTVRMQLAVRAGEMERGLMGRRDLGRDDGMIFVYEKPQQMGFWMRNTPTPLDIGFFDTKGVLQEVYPLHPFDERTVHSRSAELQFALEMNQGWYRENNVKPGAQLDMRALGEALKARGFQLKRFGL